MERHLQKYKEDPAEDLLSFASKLNTLGRTISILAWYEHHATHLSEPALYNVGENLGGIISDYAEATYNMVCKAYGILNPYLIKEDEAEKILRSPLEQEKASATQ